MSLTVRCTLIAGVPPQHVHVPPNVPPLVLLKLFQRFELGFWFNPRVCAAISESSYRQPPSLLFWCQEWLVRSVQWLVKIWGGGVFCLLTSASPWARCIQGPTALIIERRGSEARGFNHFESSFSRSSGHKVHYRATLSVLCKYLRHGSNLYLILPRKHWKDER